jgi:hypothetical protein
MFRRSGLRRWLRRTEGVNPAIWSVVGMGVLVLLGLFTVIYVQPGLWHRPPVPDPPRVRFIQAADVHFERLPTFLTIGQDNSVWYHARRIDPPEVEHILARHRADSMQEWFEDGERFVDYGPVVLVADRRASWSAVRAILVTAARVDLPLVLVAVQAGERRDLYNYLTLVLAEADPNDPSLGERDALASARRGDEIVVRSVEPPDVQPGNRNSIGPRLRLEIDPESSVQDVVSLLECHGQTVPLVGLR